ncbi:DUF4157 domain-containing protein [Babesia caballi]|uniref:DUF4157 domain-containing protein n=1 Tax=Babesia caballi TaxID=5871 RepID=A0AAV4LMS1_BABCB|nr:DUF4157 domain-containing protein [Babesia caballi]
MSGAVHPRGSAPGSTATFRISAVSFTYSNPTSEHRHNDGRWYEVQPHPEGKPRVNLPVPHQRGRAGLPEELEDSCASRHQRAQPARDDGHEVAEVSQLRGGALQLAAPVLRADGPGPRVPSHVLVPAPDRVPGHALQEARVEGAPEGGGCLNSRHESFATLFLRRAVVCSVVFALVVCVWFC